MRIPVVKVVRREDGHVCDINESDYNANQGLYDLWKEEEEEAPAPPPKKERKAPAKGKK